MKNFFEPVMKALKKLISLIKPPLPVCTQGNQGNSAMERRVGKDRNFSKIRSPYILKDTRRKRPGRVKRQS